jgi:hypothetical protein
MLVGTTSLPQQLPEVSDAGYLWLLGVMVYGIIGPLGSLGFELLCSPLSPRSVQPATHSSIPALN